MPQFPEVRDARRAPTARRTPHTDVRRHRRPSEAPLAHATAPAVARKPTPPWSRVDILGAGVDPCTTDGTIDWMRERLDEGHGGWLITANLDQLRHFNRDSDGVRGFFGSADLVVADGMPLVWASRLSGSPLPQRVAGSDLVESLTAGLAEDGRRLFLLGGNPGVAERAAGVLHERHPDLQIAGTLCPPFGFEHREEAMRDIRDELAAARPDVVYVALGFPKQERVIAALRDHFPDVWFVGVGISFSFVAGEVRRAPAWVQKAGLEWVHRLVQEPRRLFRRYLIDGLPFAAVLFAKSLRRRVRRPALQLGR